MNQQSVIRVSSVEFVQGAEGIDRSAVEVNLILHPDDNVD